MQNKIQHPHWGWWLSIISGMALVALIAFNDNAYQVWHDGVTAMISQTIFQWIWWLAILAHAGEAGYALLLCRRRRLPTTAQWAMQTFMLGYPSLRLLKQALNPELNKGQSAGFQTE